MDVKPKTAAASRVEIDIGELRLQGFPAREGRQIGRAVERELARLMTGGPSLANQSVERLDAGKVRFTGATRSQIAGARIAEAVYRSLTRGSR
jgi:hypothetical protein